MSIVAVLIILSKLQYHGLNSINKLHSYNLNSKQGKRELSGAFMSCKSMTKPPTPSKREYGRSGTLDNSE